MPDKLSDAAVTVLEHVRQARPLIQIMTNAVTMGDVAHATLAIGARPVMAQAAEEVAEIVASASALVLNLGTPSHERIEAMVVAGRAANAGNIPIIFDPLGAGASVFRVESTSHILSAMHPSVIRGNAGEIAALAGIPGQVSGVDARDTQYDRAAVAHSVSASQHAVAVISGAVDYISDGTRVFTIENGTPDLRRVSGAGDMLDALIGAALAVENDPLVAAISGSLWIGIAAEVAAIGVKGIGSFRVALFDALDKLDESAILARARIALGDGGGS